jgi:hypothetical protein
MYSAQSAILKPARKYSTYNAYRAQQVHTGISLPPSAFARGWEDEMVARLGPTVHFISGFPEAPLGARDKENPEEIPWALLLFFGSTLWYGVPCLDDFTPFHTLLHGDEVVQRQAWRGNRSMYLKMSLHAAQTLERRIPCRADILLQKTQSRTYLYRENGPVPEQGQQSLDHAGTRMLPPWVEG